MTEQTEQAEADVIAAAEIAAGALPPLDFIRGWLAGRPQFGDGEPEMRQWLTLAMDEVESLRRLMIEQPVPQRGPRSGQLTDAELRVYRYLRNTLMTQGEIARTLFVSINTTKTHAKNIYAKLKVGSRGELRSLPNL